MKNYKFLLIAQTNGEYDFTRTITAENINDAVLDLTDDPRVSNVQYLVHPWHTLEARAAGMMTCTFEEYEDADDAEEVIAKATA